MPSFIQRANVPLANTTRCQSTNATVLRYKKYSEHFAPPIWPRTNPVIIRVEMRSELQQNALLGGPPNLTPATTAPPSLTTTAKEVPWDHVNHWLWKSLYRQTQRNHWAYGESTLGDPHDASNCANFN
jgi:hypothetical protein